MFFPNHHHKGRAPEHGFILVATLFAIALMTIGAAWFASRVDTLREAAGQALESAEAERLAFATGQLLMHALTASLPSDRGLVVASAPDEPLQADGRFYRIDAKTSIALQDERGLLSLNASSPDDLRRFFNAIGLPASRHDRLIDTLADYTDFDDLRRLNGAERRDYIEAGLPPPPDNFIVSRDELYRVIAWRDLLDEIRQKGSPGLAERFLGYFTASRFPRININTAPRAVLMAVGGLDPARVDGLLDQRANAPFQKYADLDPYATRRISFDDALLVGFVEFRLTVRRDDLPFLIECRLVMTPVGQRQPAQVNECRHRSPNALPTSRDVEELAQIFGRSATIASESANRQGVRRPTETKHTPDNPQTPQPGIENRSLSWLAPPAVSP